MLETLQHPPLKMSPEYTSSISNNVEEKNESENIPLCKNDSLNQFLMFETDEFLIFQQLYLQEEKDSY